MQFFVFQKWIEAFFSNVCGTLILCFFMDIQRISNRRSNQKMLVAPFFYSYFCAA